MFDFDEEAMKARAEIDENEMDCWTEASESCAELNVEVTHPMRIQTVVSQSDVLRHLERNRNQFRDVFSVSVADLHLCEKMVVCVPADMSAVHAFASMFAFHVTSVGVVDHRNGGILIANLSASDLRGIHAESFTWLSLPVLEFLQKKQALSHRSSDEGEAFLENWGLSGGTISLTSDRR